MTDHSTLITITDHRTGLVEASLTREAEDAGSMPAGSVIGAATRTRRGWIVDCRPNYLSEPIRLKPDAVTALRAAAIAEANRQTGNTLANLPPLPPRRPCDVSHPDLFKGRSVPCLLDGPHEIHRDSVGRQWTGSETGQ